MIRTVRATRFHVDQMAGRLRDDDTVELAAGGMEPHAGLTQSLRLSLEAWTAEVDGVPAAMWGIGVQSVLGDVGQPWLLTTTLVERHVRVFLPATRTEIGRMAAMFPRLENYVDARYGRAIRWLGWLGFALDGAAPFGPLAMPFRRFWMER